MPGSTVNAAADFIVYRDFIVSLRVQIEVFTVKSGLADMTDAGYQQIESALNDLKLACMGSNAAAVAHCDMAFHEAILIACGGGDFIEVWRQLCAKMLMQYSRLDNYRQVYKEHLHILVPLKSRSKQSVIEALKENIQ